jgi:hypothetical protein
MDPLTDNLVRVIDNWSDIESGALNRGQSLSGRWDQRHLGAIPYDPDGIDRLKSRLQNDSFFTTDPRVSSQTANLEHGMFVDGGGIQTQGDLFDFLAGS